MKNDLNCKKTPFCPRGEGVVGGEGVVEVNQMDLERIRPLQEENSQSP